jgi:hypothetical protein
MQTVQLPGGDVVQDMLGEQQGTHHTSQRVLDMMLDMLMLISTDRQYMLMLISRWQCHCVRGGHVHM